MHPKCPITCVEPVSPGRGLAGLSRCFQCEMAESLGILSPLVSPFCSVLFYNTLSVAPCQPRKCGFQVKDYGSQMTAR